MAIINIFSVLLYGYNSYRMKNNQISRYKQAEIVMMAEMIVHQLLAVYYVGSGFGFQYIFLSWSCTLLTLFQNQKGKKSYIIKSLTMILLYLVVETGLSNYVPVYQFNLRIQTTFKIKTFLFIFLTLSYCTYKCYMIMHDAVERSKKETIDKTEKILIIQQEVIESLANIIESRDGNTGEHIKRTGVYVDALLEELMKKKKYITILTKDYVDNLRKAAPLHDIGKIRVPDRILQKPGRLSKEEFEVIKKHSKDGGKLIEDSIGKIEDKEYTRIACNVATYHHERWDGSGYPSHLKGDDIPFEARVMALADVYDALTSERCYKEALTKEEALKIIREGKGTQFDPELTDIFIYAMEKQKNADLCANSLG